MARTRTDKSVLSELATKSSIHGVRELASFSWPKLVAWLIFAFACLAFVGIQAKEVFKSYWFEEKVVTMTFHSLEYGPGVLACPPIFIDPVKIEALGLDSAEEKDLYDYMREVITSTREKPVASDKGIEAGLKVVEKHGNMSSFVKSLMYDEKSLLQIVKGNRAPPIPVVTSIGACFKVLGESVEKTRDKNLGYGSVLRLFYSKEVMNASKANQYWLLFLGDMVERMDPVKPLRSRNNAQFILLTVRMFKRLKSECTEGDAIKKSSCEAICYKKAIDKHLNCSVFLGEFFDRTGERYCTSRDLNSDFAKDLKPKCHAECVQCKKCNPCNTQIIEYSYSEVPHKMDSVHIFTHASDAVMHFQEVPKLNFASLIGNSGGLLGLFCGASLLSIGQIFCYAIVGPSMKVAKRRSTRRPRELESLV